MNFVSASTAVSAVSSISIATTVSSVTAATLESYSCNRKIFRTSRIHSVCSSAAVSSLFFVSASTAVFEVTARATQCLAAIEKRAHKNASTHAEQGAHFWHFSQFPGYAAQSSVYSYNRVTQNQLLFKWIDRARNPGHPVCTLLLLN